MEIVFVLHSPKVPENVGAACRAIKTMGFSELRIVASDAHLQKPARILAHGAGDILDNCSAFDGLGEAVADCELVAATSAKPRLQFRELLGPAELRDTLRQQQGAVGRVALVFGCEESGLSNADLAHCHVLTSIPLATSFPSLNLGQAVMLYAWELSRIPAESPESGLPASGQLEALRQKLGELLPALSFEPDSTLHRWALEKVNRASAKDIGFLHTLVAKILKKPP
ncbi:tRNA/rRNA methyltransferase [Biformimicrobium ophioploci]|uniref:tRNA/rRNA methyltransferase n=1 Tax=Biformimicrobium ophioploci TaxID=3036711 RepID=A0ABQ6M136_9GAMM|nr:tRNA/rRNA methyltransferase [Microbulbifer sp. NKW57]GMG87980.1 tRNA/rRNA methyltransferase [Microbulbifer sp. NKW57]